MKVFRQTPLYRFLKECQSNTNDNLSILDCGGGGSLPPICLFEGLGLTCEAIDIDDSQIELANGYLVKEGYKSRLKWGDMTKLDYADSSFDYVYSYNSVFHMRKPEVNKSILEMKRVLKHGGMMFVNFLSIDDFRCGEGPCVGNNEYKQMDDDIEVIHSYYGHDEMDEMFKDMKLISKEIRILHRRYQGELIRQGFIDYIVQKI